MPRSTPGSGLSSQQALSQMVEAEGGTVVARLSGDGAARGAASPSPDGTLLLSMATTDAEARAAVKLVQVRLGRRGSSGAARCLHRCCHRCPPNVARSLHPPQRRHPGRLLHHQTWVFDSLCCGRCLSPALYSMSDERPLPAGMGAAARLTQSQGGGGW